MGFFKFFISGKEVANIVVVGSGPAGLFAALVLAETGAKVTIVERGQPVEGRGKDIGALMVRRLLDPESNLCYGEVCLISSFISIVVMHVTIPNCL